MTWNEALWFGVVVSHNQPREDKVGKVKGTRNAGRGHTAA